MASFHRRNMTVVAAFATLFFSGVAHAVPVTFNFAGGSGNQAAVINIASGGINLKVSSNTWNNSGSKVTGAGKVGHWSTGLGILSGSSSDEHYVDGKGSNELLSFDFSKVVRIVSITFSYNDGNDDFAFFFDKNHDNSLANDLFWKKTDIPGSSFSGTYTFAALESKKYIGQLFGVGAFDDNDQFKIASITVNDAPSAVPLPGALPLLLAGLGAMGWGARRRIRRSKV